MGKAESSLALGLAYSTMLSTVSPTYASEIATPVAGFGLDGLVHSRYAHLIGVLNGIDSDRWNPATSPNLHTRFDIETLAGRGKNKLALQKELGLPAHKKTPLVGTVMRLVDQKGPGIMFPALSRVLQTSNIQFVLLGAGQKRHEQAALQLKRAHPRQVEVRIGFDEPLSERIYGGIDLFLMPSLFEPCGIGQMIAMRYGAIPLVRKIGGLADTVDPQTGFLVQEFDSNALAFVLEQALNEYNLDHGSWESRQRNAMSCDFSWKRSAEHYVDLYQQTVTLHRAYATPGALPVAESGER
jgi:starch synthase